MVKKNSPVKVFTPEKSIFAKINTSKIILGSTSVVTILIGLVYFVYKGEFFSVKTVNITFDEESSRINKEALKNNINELILGENILSLPINRMREEIMKTHLVVGDLTMSRKFPSAVDVLVRERRALAKIQNNDPTMEESPVFLIDGTGLIFESIDSNDSLNNKDEKLPLIETQESLALGQRLSGTKIVYLLQILMSFDPESISQVEFGESDTLRFLIDDQLIIFSLEKSAGEQIDTLKIILKSYKIHNTRLKKVDLRFMRPVVSY